MGGSVRTASAVINTGDELRVFHYIELRRQFLGGSIVGAWPCVGVTVGHGPPSTDRLALNFRYARPAAWSEQYVFSRNANCTP